MRTGLFGGTFDPVHTGHTSVASEIKKRFCLDRIFIIPSAVPPHKNAEEIATAEHRFKMAEIAFSRMKGFSVSNIEIDRKGTSYTIDTVRAFKESLAEDDALYLIVGVDAFLEIDTWYSYQKLFNLLPLIIMLRPIAHESGMNSMTGVLKNYISKKISEKYALSNSDGCYHHNDLKPICPVNVTPIHISATDIRKRISKGTSIKNLVPEEVEAYIIKNRLYV